MRFLSGILFLFCLSTRLAGSVEDYSQSSVLSSGKWFKIAVTYDGVYRIDYSQLVLAGLDDPSSPKIYSNNKGQLSYYNDGTAPDDLAEIAVFRNTGTDGVLNGGDYILFYGQGTQRWTYEASTGEYSFNRHNYSDTAYYFITSGSAGKQPGSIINTSDPTYISTHTDALFVHELEKENLLKSGRDWFQTVSAYSPLKIKPAFSNLITSESIRVKIRVAARSSGETTFSLTEGSANLKEVVLQPVNIYNYTGTYASVAESSISINTSSTSPSFELRFDNKGNGGAEGWLDYISMQGRVANLYDGNQKLVRDSKALPGTTEFRISSQSTGNVSVWDITKPQSPSIIESSIQGNTIIFKSNTDSLKTFILFSPETAKRPIIISTPVPNQDLHASQPADMVIVVHPIFLEYAKKLASIHYQESGLECLIVTPDQIYNEFSGGTRDIAAIRNFIRMKYLKQLNTGKQLKYLLLFGDGSFENRKLPPSNPNYIPTYQSKNSTVVVSSFTSDDFYGLLEDGEGEADGTEDIGIGRFPVSDTIQAGIMISKITRYLDPSNSGDWKNVITIVADDEDGNAHMTDGEGLDLVIKQNAPEYNVKKIYLDAFSQVSSVNGQSYPQVNKTINERINNGTLIFNYVGHGSETGLAHERVVKTDDIASWNNGAKLPLFITATCEFSRFDDTELNTFTGDRNDRPSAGELTLRNKDGGCIALMSTTRLVFSAPNFFLNRNIFDYAFDRDSTGNPLRLGDIIKIAKNKSGNGANKRNFSLLGDPALKLVYPWHGNVKTDSINGNLLTEGADSLKALSLIRISGHIEDQHGRLMNNFNGKVSPIVFDKESKIKTLANDGGSVMEFNLQNNIIFSGQTLAKNGRFNFSFIVPRDINYTFGKGKISYYASDNKEDMNGYTSDIIVGGFSGIASVDTSGPKIKLFMNDNSFRNGGMTNTDPILIAEIEDKGGINTTGTGIGHDLSGYLDNNHQEFTILNSYYINDLGNYGKGTVSFPLSNLEKGRHSFTMKAWDNYNNSSEATIAFVVESDNKLIIKNVFNYPNPFSSLTKISAETNKPEGELEVILNIFNLNGKMIRTISTITNSTGFNLPEIEWDGSLEGGRKVARGIYPYVVIVRTPNGETARASGRMIIL
ncbi:MAG TPA: type IX secretion system sortase PorU [Bacteroidales bacterium]|nr:type IX secretion system sortase PorU [Bacteroidales bacterium]